MSMPCFVEKAWASKVRWSSVPRSEIMPQFHCLLRILGGGSGGCCAVIFGVG